MVPCPRLSLLIFWKINYIIERMFYKCNKKEVADLSPLPYGKFEDDKCHQGFYPLCIY